MEEAFLNTEQEKATLPQRQEPVQLEPAQLEPAQLEPAQLEPAQLELGHMSAAAPTEEPRQEQQDGARAGETGPVRKKGPTSDLVLLVGVAVILFLVGSIVHILLGDYPKGIDVLPDERRYIEIARSLFAGGDLIMRGAASDFQKILYPLSLFPALLLPDSADQIRLVGILNSFYACSTVFPALAIARRMFRKPYVIIGCMVLALISPDLMYSMTFMSESVYLPLTLWLVYLCWRCFQAQGKRQAIMAAGAGVLCYANYLCKEVAWMFLIAFAVFFIAAAVRKRVTKKQALLCMGAFAAGFLVPFALMKLTLFSGLLNSYSQFSFDILLAPYTVLFALYSIAVDSSYFIVGFGVFPVLFVACTYGEFTREERDLALFCLVSLLAGFACVVFTISMREDVGHVALRQHLRYVAPLIIPLLYLFMKQGMRLKPARIVRNPRRLALMASCVGAFCLLVAGFFGTANLSQGFDNSQFHFMRWFLKLGEELPQDYFNSWAQTMSGISPDDGDLLVIAPLNWLCRAAVIAFTIAGTLLLLSRKRKTRRIATVGITAVMAAFMVANSACAYDYNKNAYEVDQAKVDEICAISDQLAARSGTGRVIVVLDDANTGPNNLIDTYMQDGTGAYEYVVIDSLDDYLNPLGKTVNPLNAVDYILANTKHDLDDFTNGAEIVGGNGANGGYYYLYELP